MTRLRFGEYEFSHNPERLTVRYRQEVAAGSCYGFPAGVQQLGPGLTEVEGEGVFFGRDAMEQFERLREVFRLGEVRLLSGAGLEPMWAVFHRLSLLGRGGDGEDLVRYQVSFLEERAD